MLEKSIKNVACNEVESGSTETLLKPETWLTELQSNIKLRLNQVDCYFAGFHSVEPSSIPLRTTVAVLEKSIKNVACNEVESGSTETLLKPETWLTELQSNIKLLSKNIKYKTFDDDILTQLGDSVLYKGFDGFICIANIWLL